MCSLMVERALPYNSAIYWLIIGHTDFTDTTDFKQTKCRDNKLLPCNGKGDVGGRLAQRFLDCFHHFFTTESTSHDGSIGCEEDNLWNGFNIVGF